MAGRIRQMDRYIVFECIKGYGSFRKASFSNESQAENFANIDPTYFVIDMIAGEGLKAATDKWK